MKEVYFIAKRISVSLNVDGTDGSIFPAVIARSDALEDRDVHCTSSTCWSSSTAVKETDLVEMVADGYLQVGTPETALRGINSLKLSLG